MRPLDDYKDIDDLQRILIEQFNRNLGSVYAGLRNLRHQNRKSLKCERSAHQPIPDISNALHSVPRSMLRLNRGRSVAIEGLPYSGKSSAGALYLRGANGAALFKCVLWYEAQRGDTLEEMDWPNSRVSSRRSG